MPETKTKYLFLVINHSITTIITYFLESDEVVEKAFQANQTVRKSRSTEILRGR